MPRNTTTHDSKLLFVGPTPATGSHTTGNIKQLFRIQSINHSFNFNEENVSQYGAVAAIDRVETEAPTVELDFSYYVVDMINELNLGFSPNTGSSFVGSILSETTHEKNYFIFITDKGTDASGATAADGAVIGFGNGFISSYSIEAAVGGFATANVTVSASNIAGFEDGVAEDIPAVNPTTGERITGTTFTLPAPTSNAHANQPSVIRKGDISLDFTDAGALFQDLTTVCPQSFSISFDFAREPVDCLGSRFASSKDPQFPIDVTMTVEFYASDIATGDLASLLCNRPSYNPVVTLTQPSCDGSGATAAQFTVKNAKLQSQSWTSSIGPAETVSVTFLGQISNANDTTNGLTASGVTGYA